MSNSNSDFLELQRQAAAIADKWVNNESGKGNGDSVSAIIGRIRKAYYFMQHELADHKKHLAKLDNLYKENAIAAPKMEARKAYAEAVQTIQDNVKKEIVEFVDKKDESISKMVSKAPSEERLRLLQALNMRNDITKAELMRHIPEAQGNYQELMVLQSVARNNGFKLSLPHQMNISELAQGLVQLKQYLFRATAEIGKSWEDTDAAFRAFYYDGEPNADNVCADPTVPYYLRLFDDLPALNELEVTAENELSHSEEAMLDMIFNGIGEDPKDLNTISKTLKIMDEHPAAVPLMRMSDRYKKYVSEAEAVEARMEKDYE